MAKITPVKQIYDFKRKNKIYRDRFRNIRTRATNKTNRVENQ